jgi:flavin reductase (DIM6/NTAB) family NADH-FMN oxidoreductase RutF
MLVKNFVFRIAPHSNQRILLSQTFNQRRQKETIHVQEHFKLAMRQWQTGICVVTTRSKDGKPVGLVCNSFASISLDPPLVSWAVDHGSSAIDIWSDTDSYTIHILPRMEDPMSHPLIATFVQRGGDKFAGLEYELSEHGDPVFPEVETRFDCTMFQRIPLGDHDLLVGQVTNAVHPQKNGES